MRPHPGGSPWPRSWRSSPPGSCRSRFTAYDGSTAGPDDATLGLDLKTPRGTTYLATSPGDLGFARAYVSGDLEPHGVHPGDPYELLKALADKLDFKRPPARVLANIVRSIGFEHLKPIAPPPQEALPRWRRIAEGLRHSRDPRRRGHPPPLRRVQHVLRVGARPVDDLHLRVLSPRRRDAGGGAGEQVPAGVREAAAEAGRSAARRGLRLGRHGPLRRRATASRRSASPCRKSRPHGPRRRSPMRA